MLKFVICSNPDCNFSIETVLRESYCLECGAKVLFSCPHCKDFNFRVKNQKRCGGCGELIKPEAKKAKKPKLPPAE